MKLTEEEEVLATAYEAVFKTPAGLIVRQDLLTYAMAYDDQGNRRDAMTLYGRLEVCLGLRAMKGRRPEPKAPKRLELQHG